MVHLDALKRVYKTDEIATMPLSHTCYAKIMLGGREEIAYEQTSAQEYLPMSELSHHKVQCQRGTKGRQCRSYVLVT